HSAVVTTSSAAHLPHLLSFPTRRSSDLRVHRAIAGIDALDLARHEAIGDVARIGAAIFLRQGDADQAELAHLVEDLAIGLQRDRSEEHTSELQSHLNLVCRLLLENKTTP